MPFGVCLIAHIELTVEGNSTDDTWETIQKMQAKYKDSHDIKILQQPGKERAMRFVQATTLPQETY